MGYSQGTDLGIYSSWLKEFSLSNYINMLNDSTTTWRHFRKQSVKWDGKHMVIPLRTQRNASPMFVERSTTAGAGLTTLSTPGYQGVDVAYSVPRLFTSSIMLPQDAMDQAKSDKGAFFKLVDLEMMGLVDDTKERLDAQCYDDGSGKLPYFLKYDGTNVMPSVLSVSNTEAVVNGGAYYFIGKRVQIYESDYSIDYTRAANLSTADNFVSVKTIVRNTDGTATVTFVPGCDLTADAIDLDSGFEVNHMSGNEQIHDYGSLKWTDASNYNGRAFQGMTGMIASYNPLYHDTAGSEVGYLGLNRADASKSFWKSRMDMTAGAANAHDWTDTTNGNPALVLQEMLDGLHEDSMGKPDKLFTNRKGTRVMQSLISNGNQRFVNTANTVIGFTEKTQDDYPNDSDWVMFANTPIIVDKYASCYFTTHGEQAGDAQYCPFWVVDSKTIYLGEVKDFSWWAPQGDIFMAVPGSAGSNYQYGVVANIVMQGDWVCDAPNRNGALTMIKVDSYDNT